MIHHKKKNKTNIVFFAIILILGIIVGSIILKNISSKNIIDNDLLNDTKNISEQIVNEFEKIIGNISEDKEPVIIETERNTSICTFKTIKEKIPYFKLVENNSLKTEIIKTNHTYSFKIEDDSIRSIKKTFDDREYNAITFYAKDRFRKFYDTLIINGWFTDTGIATFESDAGKDSIMITNTDNKDGTFLIYRVYPSENDYRYNDGRETVTKINIKKGNTEEISFENPEICYRLKFQNNLSNIDKIKSFLKDKKSYGLSQDDMILFQKYDEDFACVRPYYVITSEIYQTETKREIEIKDSYYVKIEKIVEKIICE